MREAVDIWIVYKFLETYELFCGMFDRRKAFQPGPLSEIPTIPISDTTRAAILVCFGRMASKHIFPSKNVIKSTKLTEAK